jgi:hypothetical protein
MPLMNKKSHTINFLKIHSHFVLLGYAFVSCHYVGWVIIYFQKVGGFLNNVPLAYTFFLNAHVHN